MRSPRDGRGGFLPKGHEDCLHPSPEDRSPVTDSPFHMRLSATPILVTALVFHPISPVVVVWCPLPLGPGSVPCNFDRHCSLPLSINSHFIAFFSSEQFDCVIHSLPGPSLIHPENPTRNWGQGSQADKVHSGQYLVAQAERCFGGASGLYIWLLKISNTWDR